MVAWLSDMFTLYYLSISQLVLLAAVLINFAPQTANAIFCILQEVCDELEEMEVKHVAFFHDNEPKMRSAGKMYADKYKKNHPGCSPHACNLLNEDIFTKVTWYSDLYKKSNLLQNKLRNTKLAQIIKDQIKRDNVRRKVVQKESNLTADELKLKVLQKCVQDKTRPGIPSPGTTRKWNIHHEIMKWQLKNQESIQSLKEEGGQYYSDEVKGIVENKQYWRDLRTCCNDLRQLPLALTKLQADDANLADVVSQWTQIMEYFKGRHEETEDEDFKQIHDFAIARYKLFCQPAHCGSFAISSKYRNQQISHHDLKSAELFYESLVGTTEWKRIRPVWIKFRTAEAPFDTDDWKLTPDNTSGDNIRVWTFYKSDPEIAPLADIAIKTLQLPTGIAGVERTFSGLRRVHTWDRASLGEETLDKLLYVWVNYRFLSQYNTN